MVRWEHCTQSQLKELLVGGFHLPEINVAVLCFTDSIGVKVDALRTGLFVSHSKPIGFPPVFEDRLILQCNIIGRISSILLAPCPSSQRPWVYKETTVAILFSIVCVKWQGKRVVLVDRDEGSICLSGVRICIKSNS